MPGGHFADGSTEQLQYCAQQLRAPAARAFASATAIWLASPMDLAEQISPGFTDLSVAGAVDQPLELPFTQFGGQYAIPVGRLLLQKDGAGEGVAKGTGLAGFTEALAIRSEPVRVRGAVAGRVKQTKVSVVSRCVRESWRGTSLDGTNWSAFTKSSLRVLS